MKNGGGRKPQSPAEAEHAIAVTRAELAATVEALERRVAPRRLIKEGLTMFNDRFDPYDQLNRGVDFVRENPVPVALMAIGAAWLITNGSGLGDRIANDERVERARRRVADLAGDVSNRAGDMASGVAERMSSAPWPLGNVASRFVDQPSRPERWIHQATDMTQEAYRSARDSGTAVLNRTGDMFERHPLVIGAAGIIAGLLLAAMLPVSRTEDELLGKARDGLWRKAGEAARQGVTVMRDTATRAVNRASDAATETIETEIDKRSRV